MTYLPLARRYRPQQFDELIGQEHVATTLKFAVTSGRVAQAYLFAGPRGVGKTSAARILAKALNCAQGPTQTPCGTCPACVAVTESRSLDVLEIDGASNRGIDQIRELREQVKFVPTEGKFRVYIIDEVHQITNDGFNALLKTLEEPPAHVRFVFATTDPQKVPATILSRCQRFEFRRIPTARIVAALTRIADEERLPIDNAALYEIARAADGSLRDAESILDQVSCMAADRETIQADTVTAMVGSLSIDRIAALVESVRTQDTAACLEAVDAVVLSGRDLGQSAQALVEFLRHLLMAKVSGEASKLIPLSDDLVQSLVKQAGAWEVGELLDMLDVVMGAQDAMRRSINPRIPLELALVRMAMRRFSGGGGGAGVAGRATANAAVNAAAGTAATGPSAAPARASTESPGASRQGGGGGPPARPTDVPSASSKAQASPSGPRAVNRTVSRAVARDAVDPRSSAPPTAGAEGVEAGHGQQAQPAQADGPLAAIGVSVETVRQTWNALLRRVEAQKASRASFLSEARPVECRGTTVVLGIPNTMSFHKEMLERPEDRQAIADALSELVSVERLKLEFVFVEPDDPPIVKSTVQFFNGSIVPFGPATSS